MRGLAIVLPVLVIALTSISVPAVAHSPLTATSPEDGAVLTEAPTQLLLTFSKQIRLTLVRVKINDDLSSDLNLSGHKTLTTYFELPLNNLGNGLYRVEWRGIAADGHVMRGTFNFEAQ